MHASRSLATMLSLLLPLFAVALLLISPASADPAAPGPPAVAGDDRWPTDSPAEAPAVALAPDGSTEDKLQAADGVALRQAGRQLLRPRHHHAALSPEAKQKLDHEARCGPRVSVRPGFPWPARSPRCPNGGAAGAPERHPLYDPFPIWNP